VSLTPTALMLTWTLPHQARFSRRIRSIGSALFLLRVIVYMGFVLFAPAVALEAVAGVPVYASVLVTGTLATAYTCKGGIEAVIWTDFLASLTLIAGVSVALAMALTRVEVCLRFLPVPPATPFVLPMTYTRTDERTKHSRRMTTLSLSLPLSPTHSCPGRCGQSVAHIGERRVADPK
jgi:Na+(H+)/acetate symporter ActP